MGPDTFLDTYRITDAERGAPVEIARNGPAITYKASDLKTGAPVALTVVPLTSVDPAERERFEKQAETAMLLDHANIAGTVAFGRTDDSFVFVSECPIGETLEQWVTANGPMPADAVLRVALQVTGALSAASFHGLTHPAIQPGNLVIVRGKTHEGGWPYVKLTHFALAGLKGAPNHPDPDLSASDFASPEQLLQGKVDFRSEIYSLGATMCFLLTGVFYSAYPRSPQTRRFARPLRTLIARTLEDDPELRPQDPVLFTDDLRTCLAAIERRQALQRKFGIPFLAVAKPPRTPRRLRRRRPTSLIAPLGSTAPEAQPVVHRSRLRPAWAIVGSLLALGIIAALFLPEDVVTAALHRRKPAEKIGVQIGVPESPPAQAVTNAAPASVERSSGAIAIAHVAPQSSNSPLQQSQVTQVPAEPKTEPSSAMVAEQAHGAAAPALVASNAAPTSADFPKQEPQEKPANEIKSEPEVAGAATSGDKTTPVAEGTPATIAANNAGTESAPPSEAPGASNATQAAPAPAAEPAQVAREADDDSNRSVAESNESKKSAPVTTSRVTKSRSKKPATVTQSRGRSMPSRVPRALPVEPGDEAGGGGTMRARVVGITPAGNVILALPNGERAIVSPQDADQYSRTETVRRRPKRVIIERRIVVPQYPPAPYQPFIPPDA